MTSPDAERRWTEFFADIAADTEIYHGLKMSKRLGLLPLDRNPRTQLWEFVHLATGVEPEPNPDWKSIDAEQTKRQHYNRWRITEETGVVLVLIPAGNFWMGAKKPSLEVEDAECG